MTDRRCATCGGLLGEGASWCGQCLTPVDLGRAPAGAPTGSSADVGAEAAARPGDSGTIGGNGHAPAGEAAPLRSPRPEKTSGRFRTIGEGLLWVCPECDMENPLESSACVRCGTPFRNLFQEKPAAPSIDPARAASLSMMLPGLGHWALGRRAEGIARAVVFLWTIGMGLAILVSAGGVDAGPFRSLLLLLFAGAAIVYATTAADARRAALGAAPIMTTRMLLYGSTGLMFVIVVMLVVSGMWASQV
jgi:Zn-finger in Ran binding protein and others